MIRRKKLLLSFCVTAVIITLTVITQGDIAQGDTTITRHVTYDEVHNAQIKILDLRVQQNKIETGVFGAMETAEINRQIAELMPILDKYQEQLHAKYYIEPTRLAYLEQVEEDLRNEISKMGFDGWGVNLNALTKIMEIHTNNASKNTQIEALIAKYPDVPMNLTNGEVILIDHACATQINDCNPIVGGIEIEGNCTLGMPIRNGTWPWHTYGFITAGHCINDSQDMNQPNEHSPEIGDRTDSRYTGNCDCAWSTKTTNTPSSSSIWRSPNNYLTVYNEATDRPEKGDMIVLSGKTSGFKFGHIVNGNFKMQAGGIDWDLISHDIKAKGGDSGAPIGDADASHIIGIHKGTITKKDGSVHYVATAWEEIDKNFSVNLH